MNLEATDISLVEEQLGVDFEPVGDATINALQDHVNVMAYALGKEAPQMSPPTRGVLQQPLSADQSTVLNGLLEKQYAKEALILQKPLADVRIQEKGERMVFLPDVLQTANASVLFSDTPFPAACEQYGNQPRIFWVRESFSHKVVDMAWALNSIGLQMHIEDGFRPPEVTRGLRRRRFSQFIFPEHANDWDMDQMKTEADSKTANRPRIAGHAAGAAIDFTIWTGGSDPVPLDLGNKYSQGGAVVALKWQYVTRQQWATRQLFEAVVKLAGARQYPFEDWHANFGDAFAGLNVVKGKPTDGYVAQYGPILNFNRKTGEIEPYPAELYDRPFLSDDDIAQLLETHKQSSS